MTEARASLEWRRESVAGMMSLACAGIAVVYAFRAETPAAYGWIEWALLVGALVCLGGAVTAGAFASFWMSEYQLCVEELSSDRADARTRTLDDKTHARRIMNKATNLMLVLVAAGFVLLLFYVLPPLPRGGDAPERRWIPYAASVDDEHVMLHVDQRSGEIRRLRVDAAFGVVWTPVAQRPQVVATAGQ